MVASVLRQARSPRTVVLWLALWLTVVGNLALWRELWQVGSGGSAFAFVAPGAFVIVFAATSALLVLTAWGRPMKPVWIAILIAAGVAQHFMLSYGVVMDATMLANTMQTDPGEVRDLLSWSFLGNVLLVAALPAVLVVWVPVTRTRWWTQVWKNALLLVVALLVLAGASFAMFSQLAPMVRNHMNMRYMVNPIGGLTSAVSVIVRPLFKRDHRLESISAGAALGPSYATQSRPPLLVIVVGETARADHFSLNGYPRDTNPELAARKVLSFRDVRSCGTDTRDSVPCMFSALSKAAFEKRKIEQENLLDVLQAVGLAVLWIDNQAGCKSVCDRVPSASTSDLPADVKQRLCNHGECFDEALLVGLDERIAKLPEERRKRGIVVVMHQMGSHGPAYYKRSQPAQKHFLPECTNTTLGDCDPAQLVNAYDNSILATDHFLASTIDWMKAQAGFAPALLYMSDHGESLGEHGIFLHGLPYSIAPEVQKKVPFVAWLGDALVERRGVDVACLRGRLDTPLSHDNLYHTAVGVLDVTTPTYVPALDAFAPCRKAR
jgi:lipid A ethanolaminephosphotransferase